VIHRWALLFLLLALLAGAFLPAQRKAKHPIRNTAAVPDNRKAIEELHRRDIAASLAYDVEALASLWTDDMVSLPPGHPPIVGREANRAFLDKGRQESAKYDILSYNQQWQEVREVGEYAFEWGTISTRTREVTSGKERAVTFNAMRVLKREADGAWRVHRTLWNEQ